MPARGRVIGGIDPGPERSAWATLVDGRLEDFGIISNGDFLLRARRSVGYDVVVLEKIASFGMPVGAEVFETVYWTGRFAEAFAPNRVERLTRKEVVVAICGSARAKDSNVRAALIDRYGGPAATKKGGPLYGVARDMWSALAIAEAWVDKESGR